MCQVDVFRYLLKMVMFIVLCAALRFLTCSAFATKSKQHLCNRQGMRTKGEMARWICRHAPVQPHASWRCSLTQCRSWPELKPQRTVTAPCYNQDDWAGGVVPSWNARRLPKSESTHTASHQIHGHSLPNRPQACPQMVGQEPSHPYCTVHPGRRMVRLDVCCIHFYKCPWQCKNARKE